MADQQHPITPSPELMEVWSREVNYHEPTFAQVAIKAAHWGADQELEACCEWFKTFYILETWMPRDLDSLIAARRPKPPSLKEQALTVLDDASDRLDAAHENIIRRALESLPS